MALWKDTPTSKDTPGAVRDAFAAPAEPAAPSPAPAPAPAPTSSAPSTAPTPARVPPRADAQESVIAGNLTIDGKIEGTGHVRIAGRFKGEIAVDGNLTIEKGAHVSGGIKAHTVTIAGELEGNIDGATRVELHESGSITGDVKAGTMTVASGAKMRGRAEFGWDSKG